MSALYSNNAATTLASGITSSATSLTVATGTGAVFPTITSNQDYFLITLQSFSTGNSEIVLVTARTTDTFTIVRAQEGTTAIAFSTSDYVQQRVTAGELTKLVAGSARGGYTDQVFFENSKTVNYSYTITSGKNAITAGPVTINAGVTVTIPTGSRWAIV